MTVNVTQTTISGSEPVVSLSITPATYSETVGQTAFFKAYGTNSAGTQIDLTTQVAWSVTNLQVATIDASGAATAVGPGSTQVNAVWTNPDKTIVPASATLTVTGASTTSSAITALTIIPGSQTIAMSEVGQPNPTVSLVVLGTNATGLQTNQSGAVTWVSSNPAVLPTANIVDGANAATATVVGPGTTTLTATFTNVSTLANPVASVASSTATLTVANPAAEPLLSLAIIPSTPTASFPGLTQTTQLIAIGTYSQAPITRNLTNTVAWSSSNPLVASVCTTGSAAPCTALTDGLVTAVGQGTAAITATASAKDGSFVYATVPYTVQAGSAQQMTALTIIPGSLALSATGQPGSLIALGTSANAGLQQDVTASTQIVWTSSNVNIATVSSLNAPTQTCTTNSAVPPVQTCTNDAPGVVKGVSSGSSTITAEFNDPASGSTPASVVTATASVNVTATPAAEPLLSIVALPSATTDLNLEGTAQYLAYGTFSTAPTLLDITNGFFHAGFPNAACTAAYASADAATVAEDSAANLPVTTLPHAECSFVPVTWISTAPFIFPINSAGTAGATGGLATADGSGNTDIYAVASNPDSTLVYSPIVVFNCPYKAPTYGTKTVTDSFGNTTTVTDFTQLLDPGTCNTLTIADSLLSTLTVFNAGVNTTGWLITAPSATGTADVIHCGGSAEQATLEGSVCEATYPNGTQVTLTAPFVTGVKFGGWASPCYVPPPPLPYPQYVSPSPNPSSEKGPNTCTIIVGGGCVLNINTGTYTCDNESNIAIGAIFN
jgi:hypothetical protein